MKIYNYDEKTKVFLSVGVAQENPKRKGEYIFPRYSTTIVPPCVSDNEVLIFMENHWEVVPDYRKLEQINLDTLEVSQVTTIGKLDDGYMLYSDYLNSDLYKKQLKREENEKKYNDILLEIKIIDTKRIRALCEPEIKDNETGETWLEYYNNQINSLREKLKEVEDVNKY